MPDIAGAHAAIKQRLIDNWTMTPIAFEGWQPDGVWPPVDADHLLLPWVYLEIEGAEQEIAGFGTPGNRSWRYDGVVVVHVFVPANSGREIAIEYAAAIGEIFRAARFYDTVPGHCVRTLAPSIDRGGAADDDGAWYRITMSCDYTYWHRA